MKDVSNVSALIVDHGLFLPLAHKLSETYKRVFYYTFWEEGFPTLNKAIIGDGYDNLERVDDLWSVVPEIDLAVFPDIQHSGLQLHLEDNGIPVWGSRTGDSLELNRQLFLKTLNQVGLDVAPHVIAKGLTELRDILKDKEDCYLKISKFRGSLETTHWRSWKLDEPLLDLLAVRFGPAKEILPFLVFDAIDTPLEIGGDTYCVDGQWPKQMLHGVEWKDKSYFASVQKTEAMPEPIQDILEAFAPVLKKYRYRNQWSMEVRVTDDSSYFIDPTCRGGLPSTASQMELWSNFADIIWHGANGELVEPEPAAQFSAEAALLLKGDKHSWGVCEVPTELKQWMKLSGCCEIDGRICFPPDESHGEEIGWLVAIGNTPSETIDRIKQYAGMLPDGVSANVESLADVLKEIHTEEQSGIEFSEQIVPEPETVISK